MKLRKAAEGIEHLVFDCVITSFTQKWDTWDSVYRALVSHPQ